MNIKMTDEEKKAKAEARDAIIKHVFDNLRNVMLCATMALAGGAVVKYKTDISSLYPFDSTLNVIIGILVIFVAIYLFLWNMYHGFEKIVRHIQGTRKKLLLMPFVIVYFWSIFSVFQALILITRYSN